MLLKFSVPILVIAGILLLFLYGSYLGYFPSPFVSAVASSLLVLVTAISVTLTSILLQEQREANRQEVKPVIRIEVVPVSIATYDSILENVGNGLAQDVTAKLALKPDGPEWKVSERNVRVDDKVAAFPPNDDELDSERYDKTELRGKVTDMFGEEYNMYDIYKLENLDNNRGYLPYDNTIVGKLGDIESEISRIERGLSRR